MMRLIAPIAVALVAFTSVFLWGGAEALFLAMLLSVLETTLSFDNAVVNAKVLKRMNRVWQQRFLTWGMLIAVFGTRLILPIVIVAVAAGLSPIAVTHLAFTDSATYGRYLAGAHIAIAAFGSAFLFLVSLKYFFDERKTVHWIAIVERHLPRWGGIEAIEIALVLALLLLSAFIVPYEAATLLVAGLIGTVSFILMEGVAQSFEIEVSTLAAKAGIALFIYLNVLDSAFSLDGVVGAFAVTSNLPAIIVGLGVGALFVRTFTLALVRTNTLEELPYLEHGAHYAVFGLALAMIAGIFVHVPEVITGLVGLVFIALAYYSSRRAIQIQ